MRTQFGCSIEEIPRTKPRRDESCPRIACSNVSFRRARSLSLSTSVLVRHTGIVLRETRSTHFDTRCALGRARSIRRPAQSIVGPSQSAICKVWCASGRARPMSRAAMCPRERSLCIASAARSAHTKTEDSYFEARTARTDNENTRGGFCRPSPPLYLPPLHHAAASPGPASSYSVF